MNLVAMTVVIIPRCDGIKGLKMVYNKKLKCDKHGKRIRKRRVLKVKASFTGCQAKQLLTSKLK